MAKTLSEQLTSVQNAIEKIEGGAQSVGVDGMQLTKADLDALYRRESSLLQRIERASSGPSRTVCEL